MKAFGEGLSERLVLLVMFAWAPLREEDMARS